MVFRLSHNGKISAYLSPDMSQVEWSQAQDAHREQMAEAFAYASAAIKDPAIREIYVQMALEQKKNENRPYDMAVSDYYHNHNNLLEKNSVGCAALSMEDRKPEGEKAKEAEVRGGSHCGSVPDTVLTRRDSARVCTARPGSLLTVSITPPSLFIKKPSGIFCTGVQTLAGRSFCSSLTQILQGSGL